MCVYVRIREARCMVLRMQDVCTRVHMRMHTHLVVAHCGAAVHLLRARACVYVCAYTEWQQRYSRVYVCVCIVYSYTTREYVEQKHTSLRCTLTHIHTHV